MGIGMHSMHMIISMSMRQAIAQSSLCLIWLVFAQRLFKSLAELRIHLLEFSPWPGTLLLITDLAR